MNSKFYSNPVSAGHHTQAELVKQCSDGKVQSFVPVIDKASYSNCHGDTQGMTAERNTVRDGYLTPKTSNGLVAEALNSSLPQSNSNLNDCTERTLAQLRGALGGCHGEVSASYEAAQEAIRTYQSRRAHNYWGPSTKLKKEDDNTLPHVQSENHISIRPRDGEGGVAGPAKSLCGNFHLAGDTMDGIIQCLVFFKAFSVRC